LIGREIIVNYSSHVGFFSEKIIKLECIKVYRNQVALNGTCSLTHGQIMIELRQISRIRIPNVADDQLEMVYNRYCLEKLERNKKIKRQIQRSLKVKLLPASVMS
jgi:hypothetical protein